MRRRRNTVTLLFNGRGLFRLEDWSEYLLQSCLTTLTVCWQVQCKTVVFALNLLVLAQWLEKGIMRPSDAGNQRCNKLPSLLVAPAAEDQEPRQIFLTPSSDWTWPPTCWQEGGLQTKTWELQTQKTWIFEVDQHEHRLLHRIGTMDAAFHWFT